MSKKEVKTKKRGTIRSNKATRKLGMIKGKGKKVPKSEKLELSRQEVFCQLYVNNTATRMNATRCYAIAYGYDLDAMSRENEKELKPNPNDKNKMIEVEIPYSSEYDRAANVCSVEGHKLLRKPKLDARLTTLYVEWLNDNNVDRELSFIMQQSKELTPKMNAIKEYNALKTRILKKLEIEHTGLTLKDIAKRAAELGHAPDFEEDF